MMDLLIVGDPNDQLAQAMQTDFGQLGRQVAILDPLTAAQQFTMVITHGQVQITPDVPLMLRPTAAPLMQHDFDQAFHQGEALSTLWAVAAACQSTVLNRPTPKSMWGLNSFSSVLTQHRAQLPIDTQEQLTSQPPTWDDHAGHTTTANSHNTWYIQDMETQTTTVAPAMPLGQGPYRSRQMGQDCQYEMVVVLVNRAWRLTQAPLDALHLESRSIDVLRHLDLDFGVVIWQIAADLQTSQLAKVEMFPTMTQVESVWSELRMSLYREMFG